MVLTRHNGLLIECIDPNYCSGLQHVWISDNRPDSPRLHQLLVHVSGPSLADALETALAKLPAALAQPA